MELLSECVTLSGHKSFDDTVFFSPNFAILYLMIIAGIHAKSITLYLHVASAHRRQERSSGGNSGLFSSLEGYPGPWCWYVLSCLALLCW